MSGLQQSAAQGKHFCFEPNLGWLVDLSFLSPSGTFGYLGQVSIQGVKHELALGTPLLT